MPGYVCTVAGGKGGVGRTTTVINLGTLFQQAGHDAVVVDADLAMANVAKMLGLDPDRTIHDVLAGEETVENALMTTDEGVTVCPGDTRLEAYANADPSNLKNVVDALREEYDAVVVDTSAGVSHATAVPLGLADGVLLVTTSDDVAFYDTIKTAQLADRVDGSVLGTILTYVEDDTAVTSTHDDLDVPQLGVVPKSDRVGDEPVVVTAPSDPAAQAYQELSTALARIFFEDVDPADIDPGFDESWFETAQETDAVDDEDDRDDSDGVLGLFN